MSRTEYVLKETSRLINEIKGGDYQTTIHGLISFFQPLL
jgi:hypothetical protein